MTALTELAPGAAFYAAGQRIRIDALDAGPLEEPLWRTWRLCPECGWGIASDGLPAACPRCGTARIRDDGDAGAVHKMLELRRVSAVQSRDDAVIDDDAEEREEVRFATVDAVDAEPGDVTRAWRLSDVTFGAEYLRSALVRRVNLGRSGRPGPRVTIAGQDDLAPGFRTCAHCGVVDGTQDGPRGGGPRHRGWCATRRGTAEQWETLLLHHDLRTQAVRLLLPVSSLDVESRMASLTAAVLLGLREDFGGEPEHLRAVWATQRADEGMRRYLVLHDVVPGGTGYLERVADPARLRGILLKAVRVLEQCPCAAEGRVACHRCLLGVVRPALAELVRRRTALGLLEEILRNWQGDDDITEIATVADIDMAALADSELEQRFGELIRRWAGARAISRGAELELRLDGPVTWRIAAQQDVVANGVAARPDFVLSRTNGPPAQVAVFLDGYAWHAAQGQSRTDEDARQRAALRGAGYLVWNITWDDLDGFEQWLTNGEDAFQLIDTTTQNQARQVAAGLGGEPPGPGALQAAWGNPARFLTAYLADPESESWNSMASATAQALLIPPPHPVLLGRQEVASALAAVLNGDTPDGSGGPIALTRRRRDGGCQVAVVADTGRLLATLGLIAVLDDRPGAVELPGHKERWSDWLHLANLGQFLRGSDRSALFLTTTTAWEPSLHPLAAPVAVAGEFVSVRGGEPARELPADWRAVAEVTDSSALPLLREIAASGVTRPEPGYEIGEDAVQVEFAWPDPRVAVVLDDDPPRDGYLAGHGWHVMHAGPGSHGALAEIVTALGRTVR